jgi:hypothetical protein
VVDVLLLLRLGYCSGNIFLSFFFTFLAVCFCDAIRLGVIDIFRY